MNPTSSADIFARSINRELAYLQAEWEKAYPVGAAVSVRLSERQVNPSRGQVVRVRLLLVGLKIRPHVEVELTHSEKKVKTRKLRPVEHVVRLWGVEQ